MHWSAKKTVHLWHVSRRALQCYDKQKWLHYHYRLQVPIMPSRGPRTQKIMGKLSHIQNCDGAFPPNNTLAPPPSPK